MPGYVSLRPGGTPPGGSSTGSRPSCPAFTRATSINTQVDRSMDQLIENIRNQYTGLHRAAPAARSRAQAERTAQPEPAEGRAARSAHCRLRNGVQDADRSDRRLRHQQRAGRPFATLYGDSRKGNQLLIARRLDRTRRPLRPGLGRRLGSSPGHRGPLAGRAREKSTRRSAAAHPDLKQRGLLDSTLVIWGGEFGRKPVRDRNGNDNPGRDHNSQGVQPSGSPAAASRAARSTARPTNSAPAPWRTRFTSTTCTRRSWRCSASTTRS